MYLRQPSLFLLRDHVNMFTDLGKDWASGPPADYQKFIPMIYVFRLEMHHFEVNMYTNDQNIVDKPLVREENGAVPCFVMTSIFTELQISFDYTARATSKVNHYHSSE